jgi:hypothetical protein
MPISAVTRASVWDWQEFEMQGFASFLMPAFHELGFWGAGHQSLVDVALPSSAQDRVPTPHGLPRLCFAHIGVAEKMAIFMPFHETSADPYMSLIYLVTPTGIEPVFQP